LDLCWLKKSFTIQPGKDNKKNRQYLDLNSTEVPI